MTDAVALSAPSSAGGVGSAAVSRRIRLLPVAFPIAIAVGLLVRALPFLTTDFPLHDGGLFYVMATEVREAGFALPMYTSFNDAGIPFAYPPLGLYVVAAGSLVIDPLVLLRVLPLAYSTLTIAGVYAVAGQLLGRRHGAAAALAFALTPASFNWLIAGGGVTRGLGLTLALFTVAAAIALMRAPTWHRAIVAGALGGTTLLAHPEASVFAVVSVTTAWLLVSRDLRLVPWLALTAVVGLTVASPWWVTVVGRHGIDVLTSASGSRDAYLDAAIRVFSLRITGAPFPALDLILIIGVAGMLHQIRYRRWGLMIWFLAVALTTPGAGAVYATVPWAMLVAFGLVELVIPWLVGRPETARWSVPIGWIAVLLSAILAAYVSAGPIDTIPQTDRSAMRELSGSDGDVAVLTGRVWWDEGPGEWFPAISARSNAALAQGVEWHGAFAWRAAVEAHEQLQQCVHSLNCLEEWMSQRSVDTVFVSAALSADALVRERLATAPHFERIAGDGLTAVYVRKHR